MFKIYIVTALWGSKCVLPEERCSKKKLKNLSVALISLSNNCVALLSQAKKSECGNAKPSYNI